MNKRWAVLLVTAHPLPLAKLRSLFDAVGRSCTCRVTCPLVDFESCDHNCTYNLHKCTYNLQLPEGNSLTYNLQNCGNEAVAQYILLSTCLRPPRHRAQFDCCVTRCPCMSEYCPLPAGSSREDNRTFLVAVFDLYHFWIDFISILMPTWLDFGTPTISELASCISAATSILQFALGSFGITRKGSAHAREVSTGGG